MKLKELINIIDISPNCKTKLKITSPCGYIYKFDEIKENKDYFFKCKVIDILLRNDELRVSIMFLKEENNE